jgi:hypothetical protein
VAGTRTTSLSGLQNRSWAKVVRAGRRGWNADKLLVKIRASVRSESVAWPRGQRLRRAWGPLATPPEDEAAYLVWLFKSEGRDTMFNANDGAGVLKVRAPSGSPLTRRATSPRRLLSARRDEPAHQISPEVSGSSRSPSSRLMLKLEPRCASWCCPRPDPTSPALSSSRSSTRPASRWWPSTQRAA